MLRVLAVLLECGHLGSAPTDMLLVGLFLPYSDCGKEAAAAAVPVKVLRCGSALCHFQDSHLSCQVD